MRNHTFEYNGAKITTRTRTGGDTIWLRVIFRNALPEATDPQYEFWLNALSAFVPMLTQSTVEGDLPFTLPPLTADGDTIRAAAQAMLSQPADLLTQWEASLEAVDAPPGDHVTQPPDSLTKEEKKAAS